MRKMVVSDYDGTFYLNEEGIRENIKKVNEFRAKENLFVIATGNNFGDFQKVLEEYEIKCDYLITDQGACIFNNSGKLLKKSFVDCEVLKKIIYEVEKIKKEYTLCNAYTETKIFEQITKIGINFENTQEALEFTNKLNQKYGKYIHAYTMIFTNINIVEIISMKTDKNESIKYVIEKEGIAKENVYTVGDGYNDISMIQNFNGYCMKNSVDELLEKCSRRVGSVAEIIEQVSKGTEEFDMK